MHEKEFDELIERCLLGQATREERTLVEKWLEQRSQKDPFGKLSVSEKESIRLRMLEGLSAKMMEPVEPSKRGRSRARAFYRAAAAVMLLSVLTYSILKFTASSPIEEITLGQDESANEVSKKVILSDSSIVWLKGNSSIFYPEEFSGGERNVRLVGEALFEVAKDADNPFIIQCGGLTAKVLGTSFNIKSSETDIEVLVLTGKVSLSSKGNSKGLIVLPNEKAVYHPAENQMKKVMAQEKEKVAKTTGTEYSMQFDATRMEEIIRRIEGKFDVRVLLSDKRLNNCPITADFTDQSLERTLNMIAQTLAIEYEMSDRQVTLNGAGCD